jgi:hypothetical protein
MVSKSSNSKTGQKKQKASRSIRKDMEILVFGLIATWKGYVTEHVTLVPEVAKFLPFDLRPLRNSYGAEDNSPSRTVTRKKWVIT